MARKKKKNKKQKSSAKFFWWTLSTTLLLAILVLLILFFTGVIKLVSDEPILVQIDNSADSSGGGAGSTAVNQALYETCTEVCQANDFLRGWESLFDDMHDCAMAGAASLEYGFPDEDPLLRCCCTDTAEDEGLEPGDEVGNGGGDVTLGDGEDFFFEIQLTPGDNQLPICAEIERRSSKVDPNCNPAGDLEDWNNFVFLDSYDIVWERNDQIFAGVSVGPNTYGNPDVVNVRWDGVEPFKGHMYHIGSCNMNMEMRVSIVVCE